MKTWNKNTIKRMINHYNYLLINTSDLDKRKKIEATLSSLEELKTIISFHPINLLYKDPFKYYRQEDYIYLKKFNYYYQIFKRFNQEKELISSFNDKLSKTKLSNQQIHSLTNEFYSTTNEYFYHYFKKITSNKNTYLNIKKNNILELYNQILGFNYNITNTNITFINVEPSNNISTLISTIHEFAHAITYLINEQHINDPNKTNFCETESLFMELLAYDFIKEKLNLELDIHKESIKNYNNILFYNRLICSKTKLYTNLNNKQLNSKKITNNYILNNTNLLKEDLSQVYYSLIETNAPYITSYLTAIELYLISINNKKESLDLLKEIIKIKNKTPKEYLLNVKELGIIPCKNINTYTKMIIEKEKKLNGQKILYRH